MKRSAYSLLLIGFTLCAGGVSLSAFATSLHDIEMQEAARVKAALRADAAKPPPAELPLMEAPQVPAPAPAAVPPPPAPVAAAPVKPAQPACKPKAQDLSHIPDSKKDNFAQRAADMQAMDTNCDGILQPEELDKGAARKFGEADTNRDGVISESEAAAMVDRFKAQPQPPGTIVDRHAKTLESNLSKMDKNGDGKISSEEYGAFYTSRYKKQDKNKDGSIDLTEYKTDTERHKDKKKHNNDN